MVSSSILATYKQLCESGDDDRTASYLPGRRLFIRFLFDWRAIRSQGGEKVRWSTNRLTCDDPTNDDISETR